LIEFLSALGLAIAILYLGIAALTFIGGIFAFAENRMISDLSHPRHLALVILTSLLWLIVIPIIVAKKHNLMPRANKALDIAADTLLDTRGIDF